MNSVFVLAQAAADDPSTLTLVWALLAGNLVGGGLVWWRRKRKAKNTKHNAESENEQE